MSPYLKFTSLNLGRETRDGFHGLKIPVYAQTQPVVVATCWFVRAFFRDPHLLERGRITRRCDSTAFSFLCRESSRSRPQPVKKLGGGCPCIRRLQVLIGAHGSLCLLNKIQQETRPVGTTGLVGAETRTLILLDMNALHGFPRLRWVPQGSAGLSDSGGTGPSFA